MSSEGRSKFFSLGDLCGTCKFVGVVLSDETPEEPIEEFRLTGRSPLIEEISEDSSEVPKISAIDSAERPVAADIGIFNSIGRRSAGRSTRLRLNGGRVWTTFGSCLLRLLR